MSERQSSSPETTPEPPQAVEYETPLPPPTKFKFHNHNGEPFLVAHFQGEALLEHYPAIATFQEAEITVPSNVAILTFATEDILPEALLIQQLDAKNIRYANLAQKVTEWSNPKKISLTARALPLCETEYALVLDGWDVLLCGDLTSIVSKLEQYEGVNVLFGATKSLHPNEDIDKVERRDWFGAYKYLNAGTCFGRIEHLRRFYDRCAAMQERVAREVPGNRSEQRIVRTVFAEDTKTVGFDYECRIFQTFGGAEVTQEDDIVTIR